MEKRLLNRWVLTLAVALYGALACGPDPEAGTEETGEETGGLEQAPRPVAKDCMVVAYPPEREGTIVKVNRPPEIMCRRTVAHLFVNYSVTRQGKATPWPGREKHCEMKRACYAPKREYPREETQQMYRWCVTATADSNEGPIGTDTKCIELFAY